MFFPDEVDRQLVVRIGRNGIKYCGTNRRTFFAGVNYSYVREIIKSWDDLQICALADNGVCIAYESFEGYAFQNCACENGIKYVWNNCLNVRDIDVSKSGASVVLFDCNDFRQEKCNSNFVECLRKCQSDDDYILSTSFNDRGEFCIVTACDVFCSVGIRQFINSAVGRFGECKYVFISEIGRIAICDNGIFYENIPLSVEQCLGVISFVPDYIKFSDTGCYCISDYMGNAKYDF